MYRIVHFMEGPERHQIGVVVIYCMPVHHGPERSFMESVFDVGVFSDIQRVCPL